MIRVEALGVIPRLFRADLVVVRPAGGEAIQLRVLDKIEKGLPGIDPDRKLDCPSIDELRSDLRAWRHHQPVPVARILGRELCVQPIWRF